MNCSGRWCAGRLWALAPVLCMAVASVSLTGLAQVVEWKSGIQWAEPTVVDSGDGQKPPSDAIVLFDGTNLDAWMGGDQWLVEDGVATVRKGNISTKESFGDCQLHIEWAAPEVVSGKGQGRGNSGVFFHGKYEVQVLDSHENSTYIDGQAGSIYKTKPPLVNACRRPGEWQSYDIIFNGPKFDAAGNLLKPGYVTVLHNGVLIHNHTELLGSTSYVKPPSYEPHGPRGPISLQFHGNPVRYRNIWLREIPELTAVYPE